MGRPGRTGFLSDDALETWLRFRKRGADVAGAGADEVGGRPLFIAVTKGGKITGQGFRKRRWSGW